MSTLNLYSVGRRALVAIAATALVAGCSSSTKNALTAGTATTRAPLGSEVTTASSGTDASSGTTASSGTDATPTPSNTVLTSSPDSSTPDASNPVSDGSSSTGDATNICTLIPAAEAAQITGIPVTSAVPDETVANYGIYGCDYTSADGTEGFDLSAHVKTGSIDYDSDLEAASSVNMNLATPNTLTGLGDKAFKNGLGMEALYGKTLVEISGGLLNSTDEQLRTLLETLHSRL